MFRDLGGTTVCPTVKCTAMIVEEIVDIYFQICSRQVFVKERFNVHEWQGKFTK